MCLCLGVDIEVQKGGYYFNHVIHVLYINKDVIMLIAVYHSLDVAIKTYI
jgi:hypothetical protein